MAAGSPTILHVLGPKWVSSSQGKRMLQSQPRLPQPRSSACRSRRYGSRRHTEKTGGFKLVAAGATCAMQRRRRTGTRIRCVETRAHPSCFCALRDRRSTHRNLQKRWRGELSEWRKTQPIISAFDGEPVPDYERSEIVPQPPVEGDFLASELQKLFDVLKKV